MNYEEMSDFEINKAVAKAQGEYSNPRAGCAIEVVGDVENYIDHNGHYNSMHYDYCDSPERAWPIIVENKIGFRFQSNGVWCAESATCIYKHSQGMPMSYVSTGENPLREAMIVYLMMQESESKARNSA